MKIICMNIYYNKIELKVLIFVEIQIEVFMMYIQCTLYIVYMVHTLMHTYIKIYK